MDANRPTLALLAHFDAPAADNARPCGRRGAGWVCRWFAALATLFFAACVLAQYCYCLAAERALIRAARAGVWEAMLPRATQHSVAESVQRRLAGSPALFDEGLQLRVLQNGVPVGGPIRAAGGDTLRVAVSAPARAMMPGWLRTVCVWPIEWQVAASAERQVPGRDFAGRRRAPRR